MEITAKDLPQALIRTFKAGLCAMVHGSPGIGKSGIIQQVANKYKLKVIDIRLTQMDPCDLNGFIFKNGDKADYLPIKLLPLATDPIPEGYKGWILNFEEVNSAPIAVQAAMYKIVLDRLVGQKAIHPKAMMCCSGNLVTDGAIVNRMGTAMQSRLIHFHLVIDYKAWLNWANDKDIDYRIISFINFRPDLLHNFDPKHNDFTFASPRTWEYASKLIHKQQHLTHLDMLLMAGSLGEGVAREFISYTGLFDKIHTIDEILANPTGLTIPDDPAIKYAYTGILSKNVDSTNVDRAIKFISRLDIEFGILTMVPLIKKQPDLSTLACVADWKSKHLHSMV